MHWSFLIPFLVFMTYFNILNFFAEKSRGFFRRPIWFRLSPNYLGLAITTFHPSLISHEPVDSHQGRKAAQVLQSPHEYDLSLF
ncbi:hypothetical protein L6452_05368 [Arctium lappa]|uniref:Uncharacterized protein n=1 Tax=Arctium lappa TaxID=4217 RepID=A0ACB9EGI8_ARCLA|nr:hypothetical protein L6452_05368 [Arctium lappa]